MGYRKDVTQTEHEQRCAAVLAHVELAKKLSDRRLALAADRLTIRLDDRRKVPWEGKYWPSQVVMELPAYGPRKFGEHSVTFEQSHHDGLYYQIRLDQSADEWDEIATLPVQVYFDPEETKKSLDLAERRAVMIARALDSASDE